MIEIENVSMTRQGTRILDDVTLALPKGGITALIGPNGAGKSSLLSLIARLQPLESGRILVDGLSVATTASRVLAKKLSILRQEGIAAGRLRVRELVAFGRFPHSEGRPAAEDERMVDAALSRFGLEEMAGRFLETLSGGQRQRALVAMTFCQGTDYMLLDEPLNNLDMFYARQLMQSLRAAADEEGRTVLIVLHDVNQAAAHADRIVAMRDGRIVAQGTPHEVLTTDTLREIFGFTMAVETFGGKPLVLHHL
jgi:iron complex transport system ATP-binding protein